jgi:hypothetical protein
VVPKPAAPLARVLRGLVLAPFLVFGFEVGVRAVGLHSDLVWYLFAGTAGLIATPLAYLEATLHGRGFKLQALASLLALLPITGLLWLGLGQSVYANEVWVHGNQTGAFDTSTKLITQLTLDDALTCLLPLALPFAASLLMNLLGIRRRWQPWLLLFCLPPAAGLLGPSGPVVQFALTLVLSLALLVPVATALSDAAASYWARRRGA